MKTLVKKLLRNLLPAKAWAYISLIQSTDSYLYETGWMQSLQKKRPIDGSGNPIPWMNFSVVGFLAERLTNDLKVFEYGSGHSTYFFAKKVKQVTSVECDVKWFRTVKAQAPENVRQIFKEKDNDGDYCRVIGTMGDTFDVVVIDGLDRVNCVKQAIPALSSRGVVLLDDAQRDQYDEGIVFAKEKGFRVLVFEGLKANGSKINKTAVFYRDGNCLGI